MGFYIAREFGVGDFLEMIGGDVLVVDYEEIIGSFDVRVCARGIGADILTQVD